MSATSPVAHHHGGDGGNDDLDRPSHVPTQCDDSVNPRAKKRGRKSNKLMAFEASRSDLPGGKVTIEFDEAGGTYKAVGKRAATFNNAIGLIVKDLLKPYFFTWEDQSKETRALIWPRVRQAFNFPDDTAHHEAVYRQARQSLKDWKHDLHSYYKKTVEEHGEDQASELQHDSLETVHDWHRYISYIHSDRFKKISERNKKNYLQKKTKSLHGSKSFASYRHEKRDAQGQIMSLIDNYEQRHRKKDRWTSEHARIAHEKMKETQVTQMAQDPMQRHTDKDIIGQVLKSGRGHNTGIGPTLRKYAREDLCVGSSHAAPSQPPSPTVTLTVDQVNELNAYLKRIHEDQTRMWDFMTRFHPDFTRGREPPPSPPCVSPPSPQLAQARRREGGEGNEDTPIVLEDD